MPRHDQIFKGLLRTFLADFLRLVVPDLTARLDLARAEFLDKEFFSDWDKGHRRELDLLVKVPLPAVGRFLLIHVEIEARARPDLGRRLWSYRNQIQARHDCQVLSVAVCLRRGRPGVHVEHLDGDLSGPELDGFRYVAFGLEGCDAGEYLARPEPLAWGLSALMRSPMGRAEHKLACLRRVASAGLSEVERFALVNCIETYVQLTPEENTELDAPCFHGENLEVYAMAATWADRMKEEGMRQLLLHMLAQRFGPLPETAQRHVEAIASMRGLTRLSDKLMAAASLEEMGLG